MTHRIVRTGYTNRELEQMHKSAVPGDICPVCGGTVVREDYTNPKRTMSALTLTLTEFKKVFDSATRYSLPGIRENGVWYRLYHNETFADYFVRNDGVVEKIFRG